MCGTYIGDYYPSLLRKTCSLECKKQLQRQNSFGKNNANYKHGKYIENHCKECNKLIDARSIYCYICRAKNNNSFKNKVHSENIKEIIGKKSKEKFTEEYIELKYHDKYRGNKKIMNGYILVKDYDHPNKNSQNDILEHVLIMSNYLQRPIKKEEVIHHIDCDRANNNINNLYLFGNTSSHMKCHGEINKLIPELMKKNIIMFKDGHYYIKGE